MLRLCEVKVRAVLHLSMVLLDPQEGVLYKALLIHRDGGQR
jgi:hypothetical protein